MITAQPAWVLSRQSYGDSGMLVEFFSAELGRCGAVVRGAHRRKRGGSLASLLQPFRPLLITFVGRSELKTLRSAEAPGPGYFLRGDALMSGLYLNELLVRSLPRMDVSPSLFLGYGQAIESLYEGAGEESLRRFELVLLSELGYSVAWDSDEQREPIRAEAHYRFEVDRGFCVAESVAAPSRGDRLLPGAHIIRLRQWWEGADALGIDELSLLKGITRAAVNQLTGDRVIRTREVLKDLKSLGKGG
jgi:DNA repair protein RecO (recombination protein O)